MQARDIMTQPVITISPHARVQDIARLLLEKRISAVPVVDAGERLIGIVSEGDLVRRSEIGTDERRRSWWLSWLSDPDVDARDFVKTHAKAAADIMTRNVVTASLDTPIADLARALEEHRVKRLPIVMDGKPIGIVSRANILQALTLSPGAVATAPSTDDQAIRGRLLDRLTKAKWVGANGINVIVTDGVVHYYGLVGSDDQRRALRVAAETTDGVKDVSDHLGLVSNSYYAGL